MQIPPPLLSPNSPSSQPCSFFPPPRLEPLLFSSPALWSVWELFKHNLFPLASLGSVIQPSTVVFSLLSFCLPPIYLQLDLSPPIDCFIEDMSGLCLLRAQLYIDPSVLKDVLTHTHTHPLSLSQLVVSQCPVVRLMHAQSVCCNHKGMIIGLSCHRRCVENWKFHHCWQTSWERARRAK